MCTESPSRSSQVCACIMLGTFLRTEIRAKEMLSPYLYFFFQFVLWVTIQLPLNISTTLLLIEEEPVKKKHLC